MVSSACLSMIAFSRRSASRWLKGALSRARSGVKEAALTLSAANSAIWSIVNLRHGRAPCGPCICPGGRQNLQFQISLWAYVRMERTQVTGRLHNRSNRRDRWPRPHPPPLSPMLPTNAGTSGDVRVGVMRSAPPPLRPVWITVVAVGMSAGID